MSLIKQTIQSKANKYAQGDCLSLYCETDKYLGMIISGRFNKYYDITLMDLYKKKKLEMNDFLKGRFWGTRFGSIEDIEYGVDICMIESKYFDSIASLELIGKVELIPTLHRGTYGYTKKINELQKYYFDELSIRIEKSKNAEKFPVLGFVSKHLIELRFIINNSSTEKYST